ncbi:MAG: DNA methyltransferase, partial [Gammaproteobacteria bacterium]
MTTAEKPIRRLYTGDNLPVLRCIDSETVDLIYLDPPFNSGKQWAKPIGEGDRRAVASFKDTWELSDTHADEEYALSLSYPQTIPLIDALHEINGGSWKAYLIYMGARLAEMRRILKPTGSIYYHCDPVMSHGVKLLMDAIFGGQFGGKSGGNFRNEIVWCYSGGGVSKRDFPRKHDVLFRYVKTGNWRYSAEYKPYKENTRQVGKHSTYSGGHDIDLKRGTPVTDWWTDIKTATGWSPEKTGYPTQKPLALLERIIRASSDEGDLVLDPFCGCATTCLAAERLGRRWIGIDLAEEAASLVVERLKKDGEGRLEFAAYEVEHLRKLPKRTDLGGLRSDDAILKPRLYKLQNKICLGCDNETRVELMDFDHIIAKSRGGQDVDDNIQLLCGNCNSIKGDRGMHYLWRKILE